MDSLRAAVRDAAHTCNVNVAMIKAADAGALNRVSQAVKESTSKQLETLRNQQPTQEFEGVM